MCSVVVIELVRHATAWVYVRSLEIAEEEHEHVETDIEAWCHLSAEWSHLVAILVGGGHG